MIAFYTLSITKRNHVYLFFVIIAVYKIFFIILELIMRLSALLPLKILLFQRRGLLQRWKQSPSLLFFPLRISHLLLQENQGSQIWKCHQSVPQI